MKDSTMNGANGANGGANGHDKAVIYCRVSTGQQAEKGTSLEDQIEACRAKAQALGAVVVAEHSDPGVSGGLYLARPGIQSALSALESQQANVLIIKNLSRYSRDREHQSAIKKRVEAAGARLVFCDMHYENNASGNLMFNVQGDFEQYFREFVRENTMRGKVRRVQEGRMPNTRFSPFGYHIVNKQDVQAGLYPADKEGHYVIVEQEARWALEIFQRVANGQSGRSIRRYLMAQGVKTSTGNTEWAQKTIHTMIRNPVYRGVATWGKTKRIVDESRLANGHAKAATSRRTDVSSHIEIPAPRIVSDELWYACQKALDENKALYGGRPGRRHILTGILRCPYCNRTLKSRTIKDRRGNPVYHYRCAQAAKAIRDCSRPHKMWHGPKTEAAVINELVQRANDMDYLLAEFQRQKANQKGQRSPTEEKRIEKEVAKLNKQEDVAIQAQMRAIEAGARPEPYEAILVDITRQRHVLQQRLEESRAAQKPVSEYDDALQVARIAQKIQGLIVILDDPRKSVDEKHDRLAKVVEAIHLSSNGEVSLEYRQSF